MSEDPIGLRAGINAFAYAEKSLEGYGRVTLRESVAQKRGDVAGAVGDGNYFDWLPIGAVDDEIGACRPEQQGGVVGEEIRPRVAQPRERCQAAEVLVERVDEPIGASRFSAAMYSHRSRRSSPAWEPHVYPLIGRIDVGPRNVFGSRRAGWRDRRARLGRGRPCDGQSRVGMR